MLSHFVFSFSGSWTYFCPSVVIFLKFLFCYEQVRADWDSVKIDVMYRALKFKFTTYPYLSSMLLSSAGSVLVEASPHDLFWGGGRDGEGLNYLGRLLMQLRSELLAENSASNADKKEENQVQKLA